MKEKIELFKTSEGWMSRTNDPETKKLFGTNIIPTCFTARAAAQEVLITIQKLNPHANVVLV